MNKREGPYTDFFIDRSEYREVLIQLLILISSVSAGESDSELSWAPLERALRSFMVYAVRKGMVSILPVPHGGLSPVRTGGPPRVCAVSSRESPFISTESWCLKCALNSGTFLKN